MGCTTSTRARGKMSTESAEVFGGGRICSHLLLVSALTSHVMQSAVEQPKARTEWARRGVF